MMGMITSMVAKAAGSLAASLLTEKFLKKMMVMALEQLVKRTETDVDNKILDEAKKSWGL